jgi:hypothetical protein
MRVHHFFKRCGELRRVEQFRTPAPQNSGNLILIFFGDEFVGTCRKFFQYRVEGPWLSILRFHVEPARRSDRLRQGGLKTKGMERGKAKPSGKKCQRSALAVLHEEFSPAKIGQTAFLPRPVQGDALMFPHAESKIYHRDQDPSTMAARILI